LYATDIVFSLATVVLHGDSSQYFIYKLALAYLMKKDDVWEIIDENAFYLFKKKNRLSYNKKTKLWNKQFTPIIESMRIDRGYGTYYENYIAGYTLGQSILNRCKYCGKLLSNPRSRFCNSQHRVHYHILLKIGKEKHGFDITKNGHMLLIPPLWKYTVDKSGAWTQDRTELKRIQRKDCQFVINGKKIPVTTKGGKPRSKNKT